jgi:hypothetical protein
VHESPLEAGTLTETRILNRRGRFGVTEFSWINIRLVLTSSL